MPHAPISKQVSPLNSEGRSLRVLLLGATGTAGRAALESLLQHGHYVTCFIRPEADGQWARNAGADVRRGDACQLASLRHQGFRSDTFDAVVSCLASRTGEPADAWAVDYQAHAYALQVAMETGVKHFVLLSAICVQRPKLAFQYAKLAFEKELITSGLTYSIVRPTALFKSLSGQIERLRRGKPFLMFGGGTLTACKPISDRDLGNYLVQCLTVGTLQNRILPIGGPGPAISPRQQGEAIFEILGRKPHYRRVPVVVLDGIIAGLSLLSILNAAFERKAEFARIGRYYATESMLWLNPVTGRYDADATPSTGKDTLLDHYAQVIKSNQRLDLGAHSAF